MPLNEYNYQQGQNFYKRGGPAIEQVYIIRTMSTSTQFIFNVSYW